MGVVFDCFGLTDTGRVRARNEDQFLVAHLQKALHVQSTSLPHELYGPLGGQEQGKLFLVADGLGGR